MTVSASEGSHPRPVSGAAPAASPAASAATTAPGATPAGMLRVSADLAPPPASSASAGTADPLDGLAMLRTPEGRLPPGAQMIALQALIGRFTQVMTDLSNLSIDKLIEVKNRQTETYVKKIDEMVRKLRAAMGSWLNKLPGWLSSAVTAIGTCLMAVMAISATVASGGLAAAPAMAAAAAFLTLAGMASLVQTLGTIAWNATGHEGPFGFQALEKSGLLPDGVGRALDCFVKGDLPGAVTNIADALGTDNARTLMIVNTVLAVVTTVALVGTMMAMTPSKALASSSVFKAAQLGNNFTQVVQGVATSAQAGVTASEVRSQVASIRAQADADVARLVLDVTVDSLSNAIKHSTLFFTAYQSASDAAMQVLQSEHRTASELVAQNA